MTLELSPPPRDLIEPADLIEHQRLPVLPQPLLLPPRPLQIRLKRLEAAPNTVWCLGGTLLLYHCCRHTAAVFLARCCNVAALITLLLLSPHRTTALITLLLFSPHSARATVPLLPSLISAAAVFDLSPQQPLIYRASDLPQPFRACNSNPVRSKISAARGTTL